MIKFGDLKENFAATINALNSLKGVSVGVRMLAIAVFLKPESWKISWQYFADELGVAKNSITRWKDELCKASVWKIDNKNSVEFIANLGSNIKIKNDNFLLNKNNSLRAHDAHARGENLSDENSQNFTQMQNSTLAKNATLQSENFKADLNALNLSEIQGFIRFLNKKEHKKIFSCGAKINSNNTH